jgi:hypothetical protein
MSRTIDKQNSMARPFSGPHPFPRATSWGLFAQWVGGMLAWLRFRQGLRLIPAHSAKMNGHAYEPTHHAC